MYDWKITAWKGIQVFLVGGIGSWLSWSVQLDPSIGYGAPVVAVAVLKMVQNYLKNRG